MHIAQPQYRAQPARDHYQQYTPQQYFNPRNNNNNNQQYRYSNNYQQSRKKNSTSRETNLQGKGSTQFGQTETQLGEKSRK